MENLENLVNLEELYLSHNGLKKIEGLEKNVRRQSPLSHLPSPLTPVLPSASSLVQAMGSPVTCEVIEADPVSQLKLKTLDIGNNTIEEIENISHLTELEEFWVRPSLSGVPKANQH